MNTQNEKIGNETFEGYDRCDMSLETRGFVKIFTMHKITMIVY